MKKICYFECFSGASGDMLLGALLGAGIDRDWFIKELQKIDKIQGHYELKISDVTKNGISAVDVDVILPHHEHHHRGLKEITEIINSSAIDAKAKELAIKIFTNLAKAEAKVHNAEINQVHFHEVGAIDAIVDIVGFSILFTSLNIDKVIVSPVNVGSGFIKAAHGILPVPAPATLEILQDSGWPVENKIDIPAETLTPTGAAILSTIKDEFGKFPNFKVITSTSYGSGKRNFAEIANVVRLTIGEAEEQEKSDQLIMLETNIDDMSPEIYDYVIEKLLNTGALDAFITPIIMKKTRPACILSVLCNIEKKSELEDIIFIETSTIGIRNYKVERTALDREIKPVSIENLGIINVKVTKDKNGKVLSTKPEYDDCAKFAAESDIPIQEIYYEALKKIRNNS